VLLKRARYLLRNIKLLVLEVASRVKLLLKLLKLLNWDFIKLLNTTMRRRRRSKAIKTPHWTLAMNNRDAIYNIKPTIKESDCTRPRPRVKVPQTSRLPRQQ